MSAEAIQGSLEGFDDKILHPKLVLTAYHGTNDLLIANASRLYIPDGAIVLDCTWSTGRFWRRTETGRFHLIGSDIRPVADIQADMRELPYRDECADVIVLDPPYLEHAGIGNADYAKSATMPAMRYADILGLYSSSLVEAMRVLRPGGLCWVKCQDQVGSGQHWAIVDIYQAAVNLGYYGRDLFVLTVSSPPGAQRAERQQHARRNHSYLWIFQKNGLLRRTNGDSNGRRSL